VIPLEKLKKLDLKKMLNTDISQLKNARKKSESKTAISKPRKPLTNKKFLSIDIGSQNTKIVVAKYNSNKIIIEKSFSFKPSIRPINESNLQNIELMAKELEKQLSAHDIKLKEANCTSNSTTIITRELVVPDVDEEDELTTVVKFELQRYLPINMDDFIVQYNIMERLFQDTGTKLKVLAIIYPAVLAKEYMSLLKATRLLPGALDVNFNSIKKLLTNGHIINDNENNSRSTYAFIDMGAETLQVNIYVKDELEFTRIIKRGGAEIDSRIAGLHRIPIVEAEAKKIKEANLLQSLGDEVNFIIKEEVDEWIAELNRVIQFFKNKKVENTVDCILIHGGSSRIKGMAEYIEENLSIPVKKIDKLKNVVLNKNIKEEEIDLYLNAIGAIIRMS
jgi:type IV pilus assembly protein PilM